MNRHAAAAVTQATCFGPRSASILMAIGALPIALAPAWGLNAYFNNTQVVKAWRSGRPRSAVFLSGECFLLLTVNRSACAS